MENLRVSSLCLIQDIFAWTLPGFPARSVPGVKEAAAALGPHPAALQGGRNALKMPSKCPRLDPADRRRRYSPAPSWGHAPSLFPVARAGTGAPRCEPTQGLRASEGEGTKLLPPSLGLTLTRHYRVHLSIPSHRNFSLAQHFPLRGST